MKNDESTVSSSREITLSTSEANTPAQILFVKMNNLTWTMNKKHLKGF